MYTVRSCSQYVLFEGRIYTLQTQNRRCCIPANGMRNLPPSPPDEHRDQGAADPEDDRDGAQ